jgi:hypothetical protein
LQGDARSTGEPLGKGVAQRGDRGDAAAQELVEFVDAFRALISLER